MRGPLSIALYTEGVPFDGSPIEEQSIGGSESALWHMARALADRGHQVSVYNHCDRPGIYEGVTYHPVSAIARPGNGLAFDLFVVSRFYPALTAPIEASLRWLWTHDVPMGEGSKNLIGLMGAFADQVMPLSAYHRGLFYSMRDPVIRAESWNGAMDRILWQTRNGVDVTMLRRLAGKSRRKPKRLIYASRPERGLEVLLRDVFPRIQAVEPDAELVVCTYDSSRIPFLDNDLRAWYQQLEAQMAQMPGVTHYGALTKRQYYALLGTADLMVYPTRFPEVSCIAAMEAMALGVPVVTTHDYALPETVPYGGIAVSELPPDPAYLRAFVDRTVELLRNDVARQALAQQGREHVEQRHQWKQVAADWETRAWEQFEERSRTLGRRVCENLIYKSAVMPALAMAQARGYTDIETRLSGYLEARHRDPDAYHAKGLDPSQAMTDPRCVMMAQAVPTERTTRILDVGCGPGFLMAQLLSARPEVVAHGIDFSPLTVQATRGFMAQQGWADRSQVWVVDAEADPTPPDGGARYDAVVAGEILEHMPDPTRLIANLEAYCREGGTIVLSVPAGPWEALSLPEDAILQRLRYHVQDYRRRDLQDLFGQKADLHIRYLPHAVTDRNVAIGWWIVRYTNRKGRPTGALDYERRWLTERPYHRIALCMIVKDGANDIRRCLTSVLSQVDEVHICLDNRTKDKTRDVLREFEALPYPKVRVTPFDFEDFSQARNLSLAGAEADWILWMDADEAMSRARGLRPYLDTVFFEGFGIEQHHMVLDKSAQIAPDRPIRVFRADRGYKFWGAIHEDPGLTLNDEVAPTLIYPEARVVHHGYVDEAIRREKSARRNLPLLQRDRRQHPDRHKGPFLVARDLINLAAWRSERMGGELDEESINQIRSSCMLYLERYAQPQAVFHEHAFPVYQEALRWLGSRGLEVQPGWGLPFEVAFTCSVARGGLRMNEMRQPETRWFASRDEFRDFMVERGAFFYDLLDPFAGITRRATVLPYVTAAQGNGIANGAAHAPDEEEQTHGAQQGAAPAESLQTAGEGI